MYSNSEIKLLTFIKHYKQKIYKSVNTNIGKNFLNLIDKRFKNNDHLKKLINRNNYKISYSCMNNLKAIISQNTEIEQRI